MERTGDADHAEDVTQEVFLEAYKNLPSLRDKGRFAAWLGGIARNLCSRRASKGNREAQVLEAFSRVDRPVPLDPAGQYDERERRAFVHRAIAQLPERSREVIRLHYLRACKKIND